MKKKALIVFLAAVMTAALGTAAAAEEKPYEGEKLRVWIAPFVRDDTDKTFWDDHFKAFTEETGAEVEVEVVGWGDMATKYLTGFMSDNAADVLYMTNEILYDFISQGALADLSDYWTEEEIENESFWESSYYNGKHYMIPFVGGSGYRGYIYNMDILAEAGVTELPTTWDELLDVCAKVKEARPDVYVFLNPLAGNNNVFLTNLLEFYYQAGGNMLNEDGTAYTMDTPEALEAMNFIKTLADEGYFSQDALGLDDSNVRDLFLEGKVAISVMDMPHQYVGDAPFEWKFSTDMKKTVAASFCPCDTLAINAKTADLDAAVALLKYMRSDDCMLDFFEQMYQGGQVLKSYPQNITDERMQDVLSHPERAFVLPVAPNLQLVVDSCMTNTQLVVMGSLSPEEALKQIQAEADKAFN